MRDAPAVLTGPMFFHHLFIETLPDGAAFRGRIGARVSASFAGRRLVTPAELHRAAELAPPPPARLKG
jgi:hypothetical protein